MRRKHTARGAELRTARLARGMGQREAAVVLRVTTCRVEELETGAVVLTDAQWDRAIKAVLEVRK